MDLYNELLPKDDLEKYSVIYRGLVIHYTVIIESMIDEMLTLYYFNIKLDKLQAGNSLYYYLESESAFSELNTDIDDNKNDFRHSILEHKFFSLDFKYQAVRYLCEKHCQHIIKEYPFSTKLRKMIELRNAFAHRKVHKKLSDTKEAKLVVSYHPDKEDIDGAETMDVEKITQFAEDYRAISESLYKCAEFLVLHKK